MKKVLKTKAAGKADSITVMPEETPTDSAVTNNPATTSFADQEATPPDIIVEN